MLQYPQTAVESYKLVKQNKMRVYRLLRHFKSKLSDAGKAWVFTSGYRKGLVI